MENQMTPKQLSNKIKLLELGAPLNKKFEKELNELGRWDYKRELGKHHENNQKEHWIGFLSQYNSPGAYNRKILKGRTAQFAYNHCACPPMLIWLCEASGVQKSKILLAKIKALEANSAYSSMCSAIRQIIPWLLVEEQLTKLK